MCRSYSQVICGPPRVSPRHTTDEYVQPRTVRQEATIAVNELADSGHCQREAARPLCRGMISDSSIQRMTNSTSDKQSKSSSLAHSTRSSDTQLSAAADQASLILFSGRKRLIGKRR